MDIRKATSEDMKDVYQMSYDAWGGELSEEDYVKSCYDSEKYKLGTWFCLEENTEVISSLIIYSNCLGLSDKYAGLGSIATKPSYRNKGYARELINSCFDYAVSRSGNNPEQFLHFLDKDSIQPLNYLLRTVIPSDFTFDGLKTEYLREEDGENIEVIAVFWYLDSGRCLTTAMKFTASVFDSTIECTYSIMPKEIFARLEHNEETLKDELLSYDWNHNAESTTL